MLRLLLLLLLLLLHDLCLYYIVNVVVIAGIYNYILVFAAIVTSHIVFVFTTRGSDGSNVSAAWVSCFSVNTITQKPWHLA